MKQTIVYGGFVDVAELWIADLEGVVAAVLVCTSHKIVMEGKDVVHQSILKFLHVFLLALAAQEFFPGGEEVFY